MDSVADSVTAIYDGRGQTLLKIESVTDSVTAIYSKDVKLYSKESLSQPAVDMVRDFITVKSSK